MSLLDAAGKASAASTAHGNSDGAANDAPTAAPQVATAEAPIITSQSTGSAERQPAARVGESSGPAAVAAPVARRTGSSAGLLTPKRPAQAPVSSHGTDTVTASEAGAVAAAAESDVTPRPRGRTTHSSSGIQLATPARSAAAASLTATAAQSDAHPGTYRSASPKMPAFLKRLSAPVPAHAYAQSQSSRAAAAPLAPDGTGRSVRRDTSRRTVQIATASPATPTGANSDVKTPTGPPAAPPAAPAPAPTPMAPPPPRQRTEADERARAAAREADRLNWERTRGAGAAVMDLQEAEDDEHEWCEGEVLPTLEECASKRFEPVEVPSADVLLSRGVSDYTILPKILGRGKFSTVFMASKNGELSAVKHTALFPHHQLISTRLLREPTLLAELPPHPNLVTVKETVRTPGHFYLVEEYLGGYVTLEALIPRMSTAAPGTPPTLPFDAANTVLDQLISAVHAIHVPLQICHRDIKPENILVHPDTLQLKLLDFGLATHYSKSEPKLSTCCGSPAFHCPEIVKALASPPGAVSYWGPEVDAWTCGVTMLRCLTGARFPLGSSHSSLRSMAIRAQRAVAMIADPALRERVGALMDMDGARRMRRFAEMAESQEREHGETQRGNKSFKSTTFIPTEATHTMRLPVLVGAAAEVVVPSPGHLTPATSRHQTPVGSRAASPLGTPRLDGEPGKPAPIVLFNPTLQPPQRLLSFIKYCLRCSGILYHSWPDPPPHAGRPVSGIPASMMASWSSALAEGAEGDVSGPLSPTTPLFPVTGVAERADGYAHVHIFQCVIELPEPSPAESGGLSLVQSIMAAFGRRPSNQRSLSTPAKPRNLDRDQLKTPGTPGAARATTGSSGKDGNVRCLSFYVIVRFPKLHSSSSRPGFSRQSSHATFGRRTRAGSAGGVQLGHTSAAPSLSGTESPISRTVSLELDGARHPSVESVTAGLAASKSRPLPPSIRTLSSSTIKQSPTEPTLSIDTTPEAPRRPTQGRSPSTSRAPSRTRKASRAARSRKSKVFVQVTDERAVEIVRKALSIGGVTESSDAEDTDESVLLTEEGEPSAPSRRDQTRRHRHGATHRSTSRVSVSTPTGRHMSPGDSTPTTPTSSSSRTTGFPFPSRESDEQESRGRRGRDNHSQARGARAPSQLSTVALKEESPSAGDDLRQAIDGLSVALAPLVGPARRLGVPQRPLSTYSPGDTDSSTPSTDASPSPSPGEGPSDAALATTAGKTGEDAYQQSRLLLTQLSRRLTHAEQSGASALEDLISPVTFPLFAAVTPALGVEAREVAGLPSISGTVADEATLHGLAAVSLQVIARHASPREMFMAAQERLEVLLSESQPQSPEAGPDDSERGSSVVGQGRSQWCAALEVAGILSVLATVVPRIRTQKPHNFVDQLTSLIPRVVRATVGTIPGSTTSVSPGTTRIDAAIAVAEALCSLLTQALPWEKTSLGSGKAADSVTSQKTPSDSLLALYFATFTILAADLPTSAMVGDDSMRSLAELHFRKAFPRFLVPPSNAPGEQQDSTPNGTRVRRVNGTRIWGVLRATQAKVDTDLRTLAFGKRPLAQGASEGSEESRRGVVISMGAFLLLVQLEARTEAPASSWTPEMAEASLLESLPLIHACLGAGPPTSVSASSTGPTGSAFLLADSAQLWLMWCFNALAARQLGDDVLLPLVQTISAHASVNPQPTARHISFRLLATLLSKHTPDGLVLELLHDIIAESPFPQLRVATLGLIRELVSSKLGPNAGFSELASPKLLSQLQSSIFVLPEGLPKPASSDKGVDSTQACQALRSYLEDNGPWLSEACNLLYFLLKRDSANETTIHSAATLSAIRASFVNSLHAWLDSWASQLDASSRGDDSEADAEATTQLGYVRLSLDRVDEAMASEPLPAPSSPSPDVTSSA